MRLATHLPATCCRVCWKCARLGEVLSAASCCGASHAFCSAKTFLKHFTHGLLTPSGLSTNGELPSISGKVSRRESRNTFCSTASVPATGTWVPPTSGQTVLGDGTTQSESASISGRADGRSTLQHLTISTQL